MKNMKFFALSALVALAACSGGSSLSGAAPKLPSSAAKYTLSAYRMPLATGAVAANVKGLVRHTQTGYGGVPTISGDVLLTDAPQFSAGDQFNLAISEVDAMANGVAYPVIQYSSPITVNLLDLKTSALDLGGASFPAMAFDGLRFVVNPTESSVNVAGRVYATEFGSFDQSFKFTPSTSALDTVDVAMPFDPTLGQTSLLVDFSVMDSVKLVGWKAEIGPVTKSATWTQSAVVIGTIVNRAGNPVRGATISAQASDGSISAVSVSDRTGHFELHAIVGGSYWITFTNSYVAHSGATITATGADPGVTPSSIYVSVPAGYSINLGTVKD